MIEEIDNDLKEMTDEELKLAVEIWKKIIDVQQHFNDIEMRIRNFAVTLITAIFGAAGLALREPAPIVMIFNREIRVAALLLFGGILVWLSFYFMDRFWYHRLLQGAVKQAQFVETKLHRRMPILDLSNAIRRESPIRIFSLNIRSDRKIDIFYLSITLILSIIVYAVG